MIMLRRVDWKFRQQVKYFAGSPDEDDDRNKWMEKERLSDMEKERLSDMAAHYWQTSPIPRKYCIDCVDDYAFAFFPGTSTALLVHQAHEAPPPEAPTTPFHMIMQPLGHALQAGRRQTE